MPCQKKRMRSNEPAAAERLRRAASVGGLMAALGWACSAHAEPLAAAPTTLHGLAALSVGRGLRFNNPYRLAQPLGDTPESVSLSATYLDAGLGVLFPAAPRL